MLDLTNTTRYYHVDEWSALDIRHVKARAVTAAAAGRPLRKPRAQHLHCRCTAGGEGQCPTQRLSTCSAGR